MHDTAVGGLGPSLSFQQAATLKIHTKESVPRNTWIDPIYGTFQCQIVLGPRVLYSSKQAL